MDEFSDSKINKMTNDFSKLPIGNLRSNYLPTSKDEMDALGWEQADVIFFSGDAYVDHPSFASAVIGRTLQAHGYKVAIVPQPNWRDDLRDFKKLGTPRLFFAISAGAMDSMVNHYTANRRLRHDDAYTAGGRHGMRPDYPTLVYSEILKRLFPDVPIIAGGIEASLRRVSHYDYWQDKLRPSIITESAVDMIVYGMGEKSIVEIANRLNNGHKIEDITNVNQTVIISKEQPHPDTDIILNSFEECLKDKIKQSTNFRIVEEESNKYYGNVIWQQTGEKWVKINPMFPPMNTSEIDASFDLPYTRMPHPRYKGKVIPAYEMIRHSVNMHRGCFGGCSFCTISAHQGKFIASRSKESIINEVKRVTQMPDFKGYISDLGGPSANMYAMGGFDKNICKKCLRPSCLHPKPCPNLNNDHRPLLDIYRSVDKLSGIKKSFIGSGVRYDLSMTPHKNDDVNNANKRYNYELIAHHVSGRLKVAPEHTSDRVLNCMRKPSFSLFYKFKRIFDDVNSKEGLRQQIIPYFISSHPACEEEDMAELAAITKGLDFHLEQVQDFTPTPMTLSTEIYYSGYNPYTGEKVSTAKSAEEKLAQRKYFFWYESDHRQSICNSLRKLDREDIIEKLYHKQTAKNFDARSKRGKLADKNSNRSQSKSNKSYINNKSKKRH